MKSYPETVLSAGDASGDLTSASWQMSNSFASCVSCVFTGGGTPTGTLKIFGSVDNSHFTPLQNAGTDVSLSVTDDGTYIFDVTATGLQYLRVGYTFASGTGSLNIKTYTKGF